MPTSSVTALAAAMPPVTEAIVVLPLPMPLLFSLLPFPTPTAALGLSVRVTVCVLSSFSDCDEIGVAFWLSVQK